MACSRTVPSSPAFVCHGHPKLTRKCAKMAHLGLPYRLQTPATSPRFEAGGGGGGLEGERGGCGMVEEPGNCAIGVSQVCHAGTPAPSRSCRQGQIATPKPPSQDQWQSGAGVSPPSSPGSRPEPEFGQFPLNSPAEANPLCHAGLSALAPCVGGSHAKTGGFGRSCEFPVEDCGPTAFGTCWGSGWCRAGGGIYGLTRFLPRSKVVNCGSRNSETASLCLSSGARCPKSRHGGDTVAGTRGY